MALPQETITTIEEYEALPEGIRAEVFDGQIQYMESPSQVHQDISRELSYIFTDYLKKKNGTYKFYSAPFDVRLSNNPLIVVQPDIMIICDKDKLDGKRCNGAPDFIIENASPSNRSDDYIRKLFYYKNFGVREYCIVDPERKTVTVHYFERDNIDVQYPFNATIKVNLYDDLFILLLIFCITYSVYPTPRNFQRTRKNIMAQANIQNQRIHALRHIFDSRALRSGIEIKVVSELLGHATVALTYNKYIHIFKYRKYSLRSS